MNRHELHFVSSSDAERAESYLRTHFIAMNLTIGHTAVDLVLSFETKEIIKAAQEIALRDRLHCGMAAFNEEVEDAHA